MGIERPYIKECVLPLLFPKFLHSNLQSCAVFSVCRRVRQDLSCQWLKFRLCSHIGAHFSEQHCSEVPNLIVPEKSKPYMRTGECVRTPHLTGFHRCICQLAVLVSIRTSGRLHRERQSYAGRIVYWQGQKPAQCSLFSSQVPHLLQLCRQLPCSRSTLPTVHCFLSWLIVFLHLLCLSMFLTDGDAMDGCSAL